jgi:peptide/nickel transport system substrate-binding protein
MRAYRGSPRSWLALVACLALVGAGAWLHTAAAQAPGAAPPASTLVVAIDQSEIDAFDPARQLDQVSSLVNLNTYDTLVTYKSLGELHSFVGVLAAEWRVSDDSLEYTFRLKDGVRFSSGNPVTADDVRFSLTRLKNLGGKPAWLMDPLKEIRVVDRLTVKMLLREPFGDWLAVLAAPNAVIMDAKVVRQAGGTDAATARKEDRAEEWLNQNSAGSGPFVLKGWVRNRRVTLERNPAYHLGPPRLERVELRDVPSPSEQRRRLEAGEVDIALNLAPEQVTAVRAHPGVRVITGRSLDNLYLGLTCSPQVHPELSKKEVRQAIRAAIDYDGLLALAGSEAVRGPAVFSIGVLGLTREEADRLNPRLDLEQARQLLARAGLAGGFRFPLRYPIGPTPTGLGYEAVAQKLQTDLRKVGIEAQLRPEDPAVLMTRYRAKTEVAVLSYHTPDYIGPSAWSDPMTLHTWAPRLHYESARARELTRRADRSTDPVQRAAQYQDLLKLLVDEGPYIMLVQGGVSVGARKTVQGYEPLPLGYARLASVSK